MNKENNSEVKDEKKQITEMLAESLEINREMAKSLKFIKTYFHWRAFWNIAKIAILVIIVIFGALSFKTAVNYFQGYTNSISTYSDQLNQLSNITDLLDINKY